jgi:hypothetical protein
VRQLFQRNSAGDIAGVISLFRDDASHWIATTRETLGMGQLPDALKSVQSRLDGTIRYEIGTMVAEPNKIAAQVEAFATTVEGATYNNLITSTSSSRAARSCGFVNTTTRPTSSTRYARGNADQEMV